MNSINTINPIIGIFTNQDIIIRLALVLLLTLYSAFSIIFARQIYITNNIINQVNFSPIFKSLSIINIALSVSLLIVVMILL